MATGDDPATALLLFLLYSTSDTSQIQLCIRMRYAKARRRYVYRKALHVFYLDRGGMRVCDRERIRRPGRSYVGEQVPAQTLIKQHISMRIGSENSWNFWKKGEDLLGLHR